MNLKIRPEHIVAILLTVATVTLATIQIMYPSRYVYFGDGVYQDTQTGDFYRGGKLISNRNK